MEKAKQTLTLSNGVEMPILGLGTYKMTDPKLTVIAIKNAIKLGYPLIDTAEYYQNQPLVGKAIKESGKPREDLFITSKIWPNSNDPKKIRERFNKMLEELDTDYLDLALVHWPLPYGNEVYKVLEEFYEKGKARAIGVSNYNPQQMAELIKIAKIKPMVNQIELHPLAPRREEVALAHDNNIVITSWQTLMKGGVNEIPLLQELAKKYKTDPTAIALNWAIQQNIAVIPKANQAPHQIANLRDVDKFELTNEEIQQINHLDKIPLNLDSREFQAL